ncbi:polycystin-2-like protein 2 [Amazona ochrocephala]
MLHCLDHSTASTLSRSSSSAAAASPVLAWEPHQPLSAASLYVYLQICRGPFARLSSSGHNQPPSPADPPPGWPLRARGWRRGLYLEPLPRGAPPRQGGPERTHGNESSGLRGREGPGACPARAGDASTAARAPKARESSMSEQELKDMLRELVIYLIFLIDLCILAFGMVSVDMYHLNTVMSRLFMEPAEGKDGFGTIRSKADFWKFVQGPLLDGLYWDKWYNNTTLPFQNYSHIYYENLLLGVVQVRQVKVRNNTCSIYPYFRSFLDDCYSDYHYQAEDRSDDALRNESEWKYTPADPFTPWYLGNMGLYSSGGYLFTLPKSKQESMEKLASLKQNNWLTRGTRAVFIDFSTYNANLNLFCIVRLVVEFPATGGAFTSIHIYSVKLLRYITHYDYFLASCEIIFCLFIITFIIQEAIKIVKLKREYFRSGWSWLDLMLLMVSILAIIFNIYSTVEVSLLMEELLSDANVYPDFYFLTFWQVLYNNMIAVNIFFAWIKVLKYVRFNRTMEQLSSTLSRCAKDIIGFAVMFFIVFFAYAQFGYLVFGSQVEEFSTFQKCVFTQFRLVLGEFEFENTEAVNRILGPIYFISFVFFVFFVLLNMFLAIINDTYSEVKADYDMMPGHKVPIRDLFRHVSKHLRNYLI